MTFDFRLDDSLPVETGSLGQFSTMTKLKPYSQRLVAKF